MICETMSNDKKWKKISLSLFRPICQRIRKKLHFFRSKKNSIFLDFSRVYFILNPCEIYFFIYLVIFLFFYFLLYFKIFIIKNFRFFGRLKTVFSSGRVSSFGFSFSITLSSFPIRRSSLIVCVVFVPTFEEVLAKLVVVNRPTQDTFLKSQGKFFFLFLCTLFLHIFDT